MKLESVQIDVKFTRTNIKNVIVLPLKVHCEVDTPWGDKYDMTTFQLGTRQQVIAKKVAQQYNDPKLALIGGFFYKINNVPKRAYFLDIIVNYMYFQILCIK